MPERRVKQDVPQDMLNWVFGALSTTDSTAASITQDDHGDVLVTYEKGTFRVHVSKESDDE